MSGRARSRDELLERFAALDAAEQTARDAPALALRTALDAIAELQVVWLHDAAHATPRDALVAAWAAETLGVELTTGEPIPPTIRAAFRRAQDALWAGARVSDPTALIDEPTLADGQH